MIYCSVCGKRIASGQVMCGLAVKTPLGPAHKICRDFNIKDVLNTRDNVQVPQWKPRDPQTVLPSERGRMKKQLGRRWKDSRMDRLLEND